MIINASPLIIFGKLNKVDILKGVCPSIEITNEVYNEVVLKGIEKNSKDAFIIKEYADNKYIKIFGINEKFYIMANKLQYMYGLDIGEAETIALALQLNKKEAIIDEISAREAAKACGIKPIGSLRILLIAYEKSLIDREGIKRIINEMEDSKYRFSPKVLIEFWELFEKVKK